MFLKAERARRLDREALDELQVELSFATTLYKIPRQTYREPRTTPVDMPTIGLLIGWGIAYR